MELTQETSTPTFPRFDVWPLLPLTATVSGAWAAGLLHSEHWPALAAALGLVLGGWRPFWRALTRADWATPLRQWRGWTRADALSPWPYLQPGTPGAALHHALAQARAWWRDVGREPLTPPLRAAALAFLISGLLGLALGRDALLLTLCFLSLAEIATLWHAGAGRVGAGWRAAAAIGLPWLLGASLAGPAAPIQVLTAGALTIFVALFTQPSAWAVGGPLVGALFLLSREQFTLAGGVLLLSLPGLHLLLHRPPAAVYRRAVAPWILAALLLVAGAR